MKKIHHVKKVVYNSLQEERNGNAMVKKYNFLLNTFGVSFRKSSGVKKNLRIISLSVE